MKVRAAIKPLPRTIGRGRPLAAERQSVRRSGCIHETKTSDDPPLALWSLDVACRGGGDRATVEAGTRDHIESGRGRANGQNVPTAVGGQRYGHHEPLGGGLAAERQLVRRTDATS
jgi:hypothetical protein